MVNFSDDIDLADLEISKNQNNALVYDVYYKNQGPLSKTQIRTLLSKGRSAQALVKGLRTKKSVSLQQIKLLAEGDSWINILWPLSMLKGHERTFFDVIQQTQLFDDKDFAFPGAIFEEMITEKEYETDLKSGIYSYFIFSGGGNDVLGGGALRKILKDRDQTDSLAHAESWFDQDQLERVFVRIFDGYSTLAKETHQYSSGKTNLLIHGYDYPVPRSGEPWLGEPLEDRGFDLVSDGVQVSAIFAYLIDRLHATLENVARNHANVELVDLRNVVGGRWNDELHPKTEASKDIAALFMNVMIPSA